MLHRTILYLISFSILYAFENSSAVTKKSPKGRIQRLPPYSCYDCLGSNCSNPYNKTCDGALKCFTHTSIIDNKYFLAEKGCLKVPFITLVLCYKRKTKPAWNETFDVAKCCEGNFCNDDEFIIPSIPIPWTSSPEIGNEQINIEEFYSPVIVFLASAFFSFFLALGIAFVFFIIRKAMHIKKQTSSSIESEACLLTRFYHEPTVNHESDSFLTSGSGSGLPTLHQRSFVHDVTLYQCISQGRYREVWKGVKRGESVAVKIFSSKNEASWKNEVDIHTSISFSHENVLGFKGSAIATRLHVTEMWLLTTFYEQGSLYDYLLKNTVTHKQMIEFVRSACCGLLHLHTEIFGSKGTKAKPAIAHRDLKTRNILVTSHGTCVIADFGVAIVKSETSSINRPINYRVGTKRYMAPEVLDESINLNSFESFKRADIYAFGLVMWEVCSRCVTDGSVEAYCPPFDGCVPSNPDFEDMRKVVCIELKRPEIPVRWSSDEPLDAMANIIKLCWHKNPEVRYTAYRVMKTLDNLLAQIQSTAQPVRL